MDSSTTTNTGGLSPRQRRQYRSNKRSMAGHQPLANAIPAEKEIDDLSTASTEASSSRPLFRTQPSTRTAISKLFAQPHSSSSPSRNPSYNDQTSIGLGLGLGHMTYTRNIHPSETPTLRSHLQERGLIEGRHSDITVIAFGCRYSLHRIILDRAPFFASALSPPWLEASAREVTLHPEETDASITQKAFELALRRLYDCHDPVQEEPERFALLATGSWLEMQDLIDDSVAAIVRSLQTGSLAQAIHMMTSNCYGKPGTDILSAAKIILGIEGSRPIRYWDAIPSETIREVISDDSFFAKNELDRYALARDILNSRLRSVATAIGIQSKGGKFNRAPRLIRRHPGRISTYRDYDDDTASESEMTDNTKFWFQLYTHPELQPLFRLLDEGIYYVHLDLDQLTDIKSHLDPFGVLIVPEKILTDALWDNMDLRQRIQSANGKNSELGLAKQTGRPAPTSFLRMAASPQSGLVDADGSPCSSPASSPKQSIEHDRFDKGGKARYFIPHQDCNVAIGVGKGHSGFQTLHDKKHIAELTLRDTHHQSQSPDEAHSLSYSRLPPFRFAAEFPRPQSLKDRRRVYSDTFYYAGSYWNIYIQKLAPSSRSNKRSRLGFYLHRVRGEAACEEAISSVDERIQHLEQGMLGRSNDGRPWSSYGTTDASSSNGNRSMFGTPAADSEIDDAGMSSVRAAMRPLMAGPHRMPEARTTLQSTHAPFSSSPENEGFSPRPSLPKTNSTTQTPIIPRYIDGRPTVKAYFKIFSPSHSGLTMNMYQSVPDDFNFSQSWGWKSSSLLSTCDEEHFGLNHFRSATRGMWDTDDDGAGVSRKLAKLEVEGDGTETEREREREEGEGGGGLVGGPGKLRFVVVLGVV